MGAEDNGRRRWRRAGRSGLASGAVVEGVLNAGSGKLLLIGERDDTVVGDDIGLEGNAGRRNLWLGDGAGVLCAKGGDDKKRQGSEQKRQRGQNAFGFLRWARAAALGKSSCGIRGF
ncbi:MAG: hypothetical protein WDM87_07135 [Terracidiphilus sp.]